MARRITVSTFASIPPPSSAKGDLTDHYIQFWRTEIAKVLPDRPDLIVLPEIADRCADETTDGAYLECCRNRGTRFRDALADIARKNRLFITCPSLRPLHGGQFHNSLELLDRSGESAGTYDKNFPTTGEIDSGILPGRTAAVLETELGRVACVICFDLNFDELRDQYATQKPDLILFCSMYHGGLVQNNWAYTCRAHLISAVSRLPSQILSPVGNIIASSTNYFPRVTAQINLDCRLAHLDGHWDKLQSLKAKYGRQVTIFDPGLLAPVLITSESDQRTAADLMSEFHIEPLDDYFTRSRAARAAALQSPAASSP